MRKGKDVEKKRNSLRAPDSFLLGRETGRRYEEKKRRKKRKKKSKKKEKVRIGKTEGTGSSRCCLYFRRSHVKLTEKKKERKRKEWLRRRKRDLTP